MNKKKIFIFSTLTIFLFLFFLEFSSRLFILVLTNNVKIFKYGINNNIDLQIRKFSKLNFEVIDNNILKSEQINFKENFSKKKSIWAFGGSTSDILCRKENKTSWPNELNSKNYNVVNYAKSGTNSDFALNSLISSINYNNLPDIILWANYVNETDVISLGFVRNPELGKKLQSNFNINKTMYFFKSLSKSIKNYSVFYFLLDGLTYRIINKLNLHTFFYDKSKKLTINDFEISAENYFINTSEAIKLSKKFNIDFYIITLFDISNLKYNVIERPIKYEIFSDKIQKIINEHNEVKWINLKKFKVDEAVNADDFFCDTIHFTTEGNKFVADIIDENLRF